MSSSFINSIAEHIKEHYDLQKEELTVVFPNKRAAFYLRTRCKEVFDQDVWLPQMLSIQEAMTQWSGIRLVDTVDMMFELVAIDAERFHNNNSISVFGNMATQMADDFNEIDQYNVDAAHLFSYIYDERKIGIWQLDSQVTSKEQQYLEFYASLKTYYDELRERLKRQGKGYYGMITRYLASLPEEELLRRIGNRTVLFAGFNALTPTEQQIIDTLYRNNHAEVLWDFDRYYVEDPQNEAGCFARYYDKRNAAWKPTVFSDHLLHDEKEIHLISIKGKTIQSKALQSLLQVEHESDAAVILADENLIIPVLNSIPDTPLFPSVKVSMGYPMRQASLNHFVNAFFTLHLKGRKVEQRGWYLWPILHILDLELVKVVFSPEESKQLNKYRELIAKTSSFIFNQEDFDSCCQSNDLRLFMNLLLGSEGASRPIAPQELLSQLTDLLSFIANKILQNNDQHNPFLLNQVSETGKAINRLKDIMERHHDYINSLSDLEILYRLVTNNLSVKLNSSSTDGLQIMGLLEARNLDFDTFYMVGVNEGILPKEKSNNSFIPYLIRKECGLPDYKEKQAVYAYHFYRLLQRAHRMHFVFNANGNDSDGEASRFLKQLQHELVKRNPNITLIHESFINKTDKQTAPPQLTARKKTDDLRVLSPTSLSTYISCPLKYFLKYIMQIKEERLEEEAQENVLGTVVHETLQQLYSNQLGTLITHERFTKTLEPSLKDKLENAIMIHYKQGLSNVGYNYLNQMGLDDMLGKYMKYESNWVKHNDLVINQVEYTLEHDIIIGGHTFHLSGTADRIDQSNGVIRIIDYKTGSVKNDNVKVPPMVESLFDIPEKAAAGSVWCRMPAIWD